MFVGKHIVTVYYSKYVGSCYSIYCATIQTSEFHRGTLFSLSSVTAILFVITRRDTTFAFRATWHSVVGTTSKINRTVDRVIAIRAQFRFRFGSSQRFVDAVKTARRTTAHDLDNPVGAQWAVDGIKDRDDVLNIFGLSNLFRHVFEHQHPKIAEGFSRRSSRAGCCRCRRNSTTMRDTSML